MSYKQTLPGFFLILQHAELALRLASAHPAMDPKDAYLHAQAAVRAASDRVKPELLLAIAYTESKFDPFALSRIEGSKRRVSRWESREPPKRLRKGASMFCGPLQTRALTWEDCLAQRDLLTAYKAGVKEIEEWLDNKYVHGNIARALAGFGCGTQGAKSGHCSNAFQARILAYARKIEAGQTLPKS